MARDGFPKSAFISALPVLGIVAVLGCNTGDHTGGLTNPSSPAAVEQDADLAGQSLPSISLESSAAVADEEAAFEPWTTGLGTAGGEVCVSDLWQYYEEQLSEAIVYARDTERTCNRLVLRDNTGKKVLEVRLVQGGCRLEISIDIEGWQEDATVDLCD
jgi:hypothetical protein